jgi:hypothetical protein
MKGLLTLICDKTNSHGYMKGAHHNENWVTQSHYDSGGERMQGTLDRIGKVEYWRTFHINEKVPKKGGGFTIGHERLGPSFFDHSLHFVWREPFGKGWGPNPPEIMLDSLIKDKVGNYHSPCDLAFNVTLWHPWSQNGLECGEGQEAIGGCWLMARPYPRWRPTYHYTSEEVIEALKIMCKTFNWEFEDKGEGEYMIMY